VKKPAGRSANRDPQATLPDHLPVLFDEVMTALAVKPGGCYVDGTVGLGGHAAGILERSGPDGRLLGLDADPAALALAGERLRPFGNRVLLVHRNFRDLAQVVQETGFPPADGILLDLGLSSRQLSDRARGFSFQEDGPLDMRFDPTHGESAADLVNGLAEEELADLIDRYGEEPHSRRIARAIVIARRAAAITTTGQLAALVSQAVGGRHGPTHPATRTFQALRIAVNDELGALTTVLPQALPLLSIGGRLAIISFHSLEDRPVKQFMHREARDCLCPPLSPVCTCGHVATVRLIQRRGITPSAAEVAANPRSRSARLRVVERIR